MKRLLLVLTMAAFMAGSAYAGTIHVTYPNGGESLCKGKTLTITWTSSGITTPLRIVLVKGASRLGDIVLALPAGTTSYSWTIGNYIGGTAPVGNDYRIRVRIDTATDPGTEADSSDAPFSILSGPFALTAPNGAESWELGSTKDITWSQGCVTGNVRLDLYKGDTNIANKIGIITTNTPVATGKYSWKVGALIGGAAHQIGDDYRIVIGSYTPAQKDASNGPFTLVKGKLQMGPAGIVKCLELTYPRRGDRLHKGTGYTIKWTTGCLKETKLKLDLLKIDGTTLVRKIGENLPNNGQLLWGVPVLELPDNGLYKMRIQTMDGKNSDMVGPFSIVKAEPPSGPAAIKVTAPGGPGTPGVGITYPIRWTSTCGKSANGPIDDGFTIDLMNAAGSTKIANLIDGVASYDGEHPNGVHNWHWDWPISAGPGKYRIRVTNWSGHCVGMGEPFQLVFQKRIVEFTLKPSLKQWTCTHNPTHLNPPPVRPHCKLNVDQPLVGYDYFQYQDSSGDSYWHGYLSRAQLVFPIEQFKNKKKTVKEAKLHLSQQSTYIQNSNYASCAGKVYIMNGPWQDCWNAPATFYKDLPHDQTQITVDLTQMTSDWVKGTLANNGILLTSSDESFLYVATTCQSCYKASLYLRIEEEYDPSNPGQ